MSDPGLDGKKAIPLIMYSTSNRIFDVNPQAVHFLKSLQGPIGIVSVAGRYRTGKSYLLNRVFVNRQRAFCVGPTVNACTKGLWIWPYPVQGRTKDGRNCSVLVIDSEGIGALDESTDHDTRIFSLAILLSSCFVYNSVGAIDENAISSLSLVVNITKHIHINSSQDGVNEYSEYFPEFMWVVRDFTLRLVDSIGSPITPKEYLEKSLQLLKPGENDEKNKIRKHLMGYFKERECVTLVRPIESEKDLQNLDFMELESLRPEFVSQVHLLREKVIYKIKPKSLNGKELNGEMFANLMSSYVNAMNNGVVPNIESSWTLVCRLQNKKVVDEAKELYEKTVNDGKKFPTNEENLKKLHKKAKDAAVGHFTSFIVVEEPKLLSELTTHISQRYQNFKDENLNAAKRDSSNFLNESYVKVEEKIKKGEISSLQDFDRHMKLLEKDYDSFFSGSLKKETYLEFYKEKLFRISDLLLNSSKNELNIHKDLTSEQISRLEKDFKNVSDQLLQEKTSLQKNFSLFQTERSELQAREKSLKDQNSMLMMEREKLETSLRETSEALKYKNQIELEKSNLKNSELLENIKELEREIKRKKSENEEEKALTSQKIKILENSLEEFKNKEKNSSEKLKELKNESMSSTRQQQNKYESLIAKLQEKLDNRGQDYKDLESELENKETLIEELKQQLSDMQISFTSEKAENDSLIDVLQRKLKQKEDEVLFKLNNIEQDKQGEIIRLKYRFEDTEKKLRSSEEELRNITEKSNQELAILSQKCEFLEQEIDEQKAKRQEEKRSYDAKISVLESQRMPKVDPNLQKIKAEQSEEIARLIKDHETEKVILKAKIEDLIDAKNEVDLMLKLERNEFSHIEKQLRDSLNDALAAKSKLMIDLASKTAEEEDPKIKLRIIELEKDLETLSKNHIEEIESIKNKNEMNIAQLRTFFDQEKSRLDQKVIDEKAKYEKRVAEAVEEFEEKLSNQRSLYVEETSGLHEEFESMESYYTSEIKNLNETLVLNAERMTSLENYIQTLKDQTNTTYETHTKESSKLVETFNEQKIDLLRKIDYLSSELSLKEKSIITQKYEIEKIQNIVSSKNKELEDLQNKYSKEKSELTEKLLSLNEKYESLYNEHNKSTNKSKRDLALSNNEIDLLHKRCKELEDTIQDYDKKTKEAVETARGDSSIYVNYNIQRVEKEKESLIKKLDEKKKALKSLENLSAKQNAAFERERAVLEEKLSYSDRKRTELEQYYQETITSLQSQLVNKPNTSSSTISTEVESLKLQISKLERDLAGRQVSYDRDKSLWENKFNFLIQQRDYSRKELSAAQEKFDQIIDELKKKHSSEREKQEHSSNTLITSLENRYNSQMNEMQLRYEQTIKEIRDKNRTIERSMQNLTEELDNERRERSNLANTFEKKLQQCVENEKKYMREIQNEKANKDVSVTQIVEKFGKEREEWKLKLSESEKKIKEIDQQKSQIFLQSEKERVKWALEREEILTKYTETQQQLNYILKKQEDLKKENDKLKTPRPRVASKKHDTGLSFDDFKYPRTQSGRSTPTNTTTDSPRVRNFVGTGVLKRTSSRDELKDNS